MSRWLVSPEEARQHRKRARKVAAAVESVDKMTLPTTNMMALASTPALDLGRQLATRGGGDPVAVDSWAAPQSRGGAWVKMTQNCGGKLPEIKWGKLGLTWTA